MSNLRKTLSPSLILCMSISTLPVAAAMDVTVLGFGGTFAGEAEGAYLPTYVAAERCLVEDNNPVSGSPQPIVTLLKAAMEEDTFAGGPMFTCESSTDAGTALSSYQEEGCGERTQLCTLRLPERNGATEEVKTINITFDDVDRLDSAKMTPDNWYDVANEIINATSSAEPGIVVTHGTDTLEETAYVLGLIDEITTPVVLIGSMRAPNHLSADGLMNLLNGVTVAADEAAQGKGVMVAMDEKIYSARDVTKTNTVNLGTFASRNPGEIGTVYFGDARFYTNPVRPVKSRCGSEGHVDCLTLDDLNTAKSLTVSIVYEQAGGTPGLVSGIADSVDGLVIATTGNGGTTQVTDDELSQLDTQGVLYVAISSRTGSGRTTNAPNYGDNVEVLNADNLNPQKARVLLMMALAATEDIVDNDERFDEIKTYFEIY